MSDPSLPPIVRHTASSPADVPWSSADRPQAIDAATAPHAAPSTDSGGAIGGNRPLVFAMLFGVTGALGLPLLWYSPAFTRKEKWIWSIVNSLYAAGLIAIAVVSLRVIFNALAEIN